MKQNFKRWVKHPGPDREKLTFFSKEYILISAGNNHSGSGSVLVGRLDFKSSLRGGDPVVGGFDSHTLPPNYKDIKGL
jgi:hypothetical protein